VEFQKNPTSVRHAFLACVATYHSLDYLAYDGIKRKTSKKKVRNLRDDFGKTSADFKLVDDVAHAFKHVIVGNPNNPNLRAYEVIRRPPSFAGVMRSGVSFFGDKRGGVTINRERSRSLLAAVKGAMRFLRTKASAKN
jgi:hypothetical protein